MDIRKIHRRVAIAFSPFFILTSVTRIILLFRKNELYSKETKNFIIGPHNWEIGAKYIGGALGFGLLFVTITGLMLFFKSKILKSQ